MKKFDYGVILIERLKVADGAYLDAKSVAKEHGLPTAYMEKVAQELRRAGWLEARRGIGGGYRLIKKDLQVSELINFFERPYNICPITRLKIRN
ncbi:MAG: Rrf2 family transcriptional regulator [Candidatus Giovannonibacteria bacterium]|nr:MAG: Rrf2 family transcriptional regulator [Candidatus Giovannonibacteria bacterium]